jgi:hypothetical protein
MKIVNKQLVQPSPRPFQSFENSSDTDHSGHASAFCRYAGVDDFVAVAASE